MDVRLKKLENPILRCYLVSKAHKNKIPTAVPMFLGMIFFSMAIIFTSPGVAITPERNKYGGQKAEVVSVRQMLLTSQRCKTVIVGFRGCERYRG